MIRVVLFDLGLTLIDPQNRPFPHVIDALRAIQPFVTADGKPIVIALVSDFDMPDPPATPAKIKIIFDRYLAILDGTGLRPFFEPAGRHITLSTHAGVSKPDRKIFETALKRLQVTATLEACLFITENAAHVQAARTQLNMASLQFRSSASADFDFDDWLQAPPLIAHMVGGTDDRNTEAAMRRFLNINHAFDVNAIERSRTGGTTVHVRGTLWKPVGRLHGTEEVLAPFPTKGDVTYGSAGEIRAVRFTEPDSSELADAASFVQSLTEHGQMEGSSGPLGDQSTHAIETDDQGRRRVVRKRFRTI
jgi:hypothetical protein